MIGQLKGIVEQLDTHTALVDVNGVGYIVYASSRTLDSLAVGEPARLLIETQVREDAITLYGFASASEQSLFNLLTTVQGVGAKVGLALLSCMPPAELTQSIILQDAKNVTRADGVGPKLAARIVNELKDKMAKLQGLSPASAVPTLVVANDAASDAIAALTNLGYRRADVVPVVTHIITRLPDAGVQTLIKSALQELAA
jgi:Holliday junction DNA helicase RuvA